MHRIDFCNLHYVILNCISWTTITAKPFFERNFARKSSWHLILKLFFHHTDGQHLFFLVFLVRGVMWLKGMWKERLQSASTLPCSFFRHCPQLLKVAFCNDAREKKDKQHNTATGPMHRVPCLSPHCRARYTSAARDGLHWMCASSPSVLRGCATNWDRGSVSQALKEDVLKWRNLIFPSRHPSSSVSVWIEIISL